MTTPYQQNAKTPAGPIASTPAGATWGGFRGLLKQYSGAAAGYSLRKIGNGPVVRLRRGSDNAEKDFYAGDLTGSSEGAELVTNGDFATDSDWTKDTGWSITGGQAVCDGTQVSTASLDQNGIWNPVADGDLYILEITIVACSDFSACGLYGGVGSLRNFSATYGITAPGTYRCIRQKQGDGNPFERFEIYASAGQTLTIDNVSLKPYTPTAAEQWSFANMTNGIGKQTTESAFATTWYDQSGSGNDASQATAASQPLLIRAGVTNTENGKPALSFDGTDDWFNIGVSLAGNAREDSFAVFNQDASANLILYQGKSTSEGGDGSETSWIAAQGGGGVIYSKFGTPTMHTNGVSQSPSTRTDVANLICTGSQLLMSTIDSDTTAWTGYNIGRYNLFHISGSVQEFIIYPSDQSANRTGIETNINDHYGIY